jgi:limonene-1,2-epoxide hydrolase
MAELQVETNLAVPSAALSDSAVVEALLSALCSGDLDGALALLADDIEYQNVPLPRDLGKAQVERTLRQFQRLTPTFDVTVHHIAERDGFVLTERTDYLRGPWLDLGFWVCGTFQVRDGKIVLWRDYFDLATLAWQALTSPFRRLLRARSTPEAV